jgi:hypothetical protein
MILSREPHLHFHMIAENCNCVDGLKCHISLITWRSGVVGRNLNHMVVTNQSANSYLFVNIISICCWYRLSASILFELIIVIIITNSNDSDLSPFSSKLKSHLVLFAFKISLLPVNHKLTIFLHLANISSQNLSLYPRSQCSKPNTYFQYELIIQ